MLNAVNELMWGPGTLALLLGTGVFLTLRMRLLPWRRLGFALRSALGREARQPGKDGVSPFSALMTALAASIGTGNIVGVATALVAGGPGALVWMELSALFGMATIFAESFLAVRYRKRDRQGQWVGGPMYVLEADFGRRNGRLLGTVFALFAVGASLGIGSMTQSNSIAGALESAFGLPVWTVGAVTAILALTIILGGIHSISRAAAALVPVMGAIYLAAGLAVIFGNLGNLPGSVAEIFQCAFSPRAAAGGVAGWMTAARWGVARGVFSNEAGLGSAGIAASAVDRADPVRQGYISMTGAFFDTIVICTVTGLAICCSGVLGAADPATGLPAEGAALTILAFETVLGAAGRLFLAAAIALFAFSSMLGWACQGETALAYLAGRRAVPLYRCLFAAAAWAGAFSDVEEAFGLSDLCNCLMALPNLACLLLLSGAAAREMESFQPEFHRNSRRKPVNFL